MNKLDDCIKEFNLVLTNTIEKQDYCQKGFSFDKAEICFDDCVSLYDVADIFNKSYQAFKKAYESMDQINFGENVKVCNYFEGPIDEDYYKTLILIINKPSFVNHENDYLYINDKNGEIETFVVNSFNPFIKGYYCTNVDLDKEKCKKYVDLFSKYYPVVKFHDKNRLEALFGDGTHFVNLKMNSKNGNILNGIDSIEFYLGSTFFLVPGDNITISVDLGENLGINPSLSDILLGYDQIKTNEDNLIKILKNVYIHKQYLNYLYGADKHDSFDKLQRISASLDAKKRVLKKD